MAAHAQVARTGDYALALATMDAGGAAVHSADYGNNGSAGTPGALATAAGEVIKAGLPGEIYNPTNLQLSASATVLDAGNQTQLTAREVMDDGTLLTLSPTLVTWSIQTGPISSISPQGVVTSGTVYQSSAAQISGLYAGFTAMLQLQVVNTAFAQWQLAYFGTEIGPAAATADADGSGQTNLFKYIAGLNPTNPASRFVMSTTPVGNQSGVVAISFSPVYGGRTYSVEYCTDICSGNWQTLTPASETVTGQTMTVVDINADLARKFYRVDITK